MPSLSSQIARTATTASSSSSSLSLATPLSEDWNQSLGRTASDNNNNNNNNNNNSNNSTNNNEASSLISTNNDNFTTTTTTIIGTNISNNNNNNKNQKASMNEMSLLGMQKFDTNREHYEGLMRRMDELYLQFRLSRDFYCNCKETQNFFAKKSKKQISEKRGVNNDNNYDFGFDEDFDDDYEEEMIEFHTNQDFQNIENTDDDDNDGGVDNNFLIENKFLKNINQKQIVEEDQKKKNLSITYEKSEEYSCNKEYSYMNWCLLLSYGSSFCGIQAPRGKCHEVKVTIQDCDLANDYLCGYLTIKGLTIDYPILTTFFEAEIIGERFDFLTRKWQASFDTDMKHWSKFKEFEKYKQKFSEGSLDMSTLDRNECLFMRWKEKFLVPCHQVNSIPGASFAGFYYICLKQNKPSINGFYYHQSSEWFQSLELDYIDTKTCGSYKFI